MAAPQPFPILASTSNSRAASPAPSANGRISARDTKQRSPPKQTRNKKSRQNKTNGQQDGSSSSSTSNNNNSISVSDPKMLHDKHKELSTATATQLPATTASSSSDADATANNSPPAASRKKSTKKRARKQKNPAAAEAAAAAAAVAVADPSNGDATTPKRQSARGSGRRHTAQPTTDTQDNGSGGGSRKKGSGQRNRGKTQDAAKQQQRDAPAVSETAASSQASLSLSQITAAPQSASPTPRSPPQYIKSSSSNSLSMAMIVPGENGRARVYFGPQPSNGDDQHSVHPGFHAGAPRFLSSSVQQRRSSMGHFGPPRARFPAASYGDGPIPLGLSSPMSPAPQPAASAYYSQATSHLHANPRSVTSPAPAPYAYQPPAHPAYSAVPPPSFRQRSMTSTQLRSSARSFSPQMHSVGYQNQSQQQPPIQAHGQSQNKYQNHNQPIPMRRLSSATSVGLDHAGTTYHPPLSAPMAGLPAGTRGRSQSVLTHSSAAGLRISMSQAQPGNVLAPYLPSLSRTSSSGAATGTTLASGGYFASRRASVSNTGLAVDPNNTIRIPAIMFQKSNAEEQTKALPAGARASVSPSSSATDALVTPMSAVNEKVAAASEASANDRVSSETLAMRRLQDMIESMRKLSSAKPIAPRDSAVPTPPLSASEPGPVASASKSTTAVDALPDGAETAPPASPAAEPSVAASLSSAAHPTSRFDSILEEDEDSEDDEAKLDADSAANIPGNVSSVPGSPDLASGDVPVTRQSAAAAASAVCAL